MRLATVLMSNHDHHDSTQYSEVVQTHNNECSRLSHTTISRQSDSQTVKQSNRQCILAGWQSYSTTAPVLADRAVLGTEARFTLSAPANRQMLFVLCVSMFIDYETVYLRYLNSFTFTNYELQELN